MDGIAQQSFTIRQEKVTRICHEVGRKVRGNIKCFAKRQSEEIKTGINGKVSASTQNDTIRIHCHAQEIVVRSQRSAVSCYITLHK